jgi:acetyl esterase/lipase
MEMISRSQIIASLALYLLLLSITPTAPALEGLGAKWSSSNIPEAPDDVIFEQDIPYRDGDKRWLLNVVSPKKESSSPRPAIVVVHGGGWAGNDHYRFSSLAFFLAQNGYVVITPTHRMIIDGPFPACLEDIKNAVRWLRAHADTYNVDPDHIGAYGNSSGGQLALMTALTSNEKSFEGDGTHRNESSAIQAVVCTGTVGDMLHDDHSELAKRVYLNLCGAREGKASEREIQSVMKEASPVTYVDADAPPVMMIHGARDTTVHIASTDLFIDQMKHAGADITYLRYDDGGHGVLIQKQQEVLPAMLKFYKKHL